MHPFVDDDSGDELHRRNEDGTSKNLPPQWILPMEHLALHSKKDHADSTKHKHRPMREPSKHQLKSIIKTAA